MNLNKLIHETRLMCWHEASEYSGQCSKCETLRRHWDPNPDYENDMDACMELLEGVTWNVGSFKKEVFAWVDRHFAIAATPQLAIIHAYLKSKGVKLENEG